MPATFVHLQVERKGSTRIIRMNRPEAMNSLNLVMVRELRRAFEEARWDPAVKTVILSGSEDKSFCAGLDLKERSGMNEEEILSSREREIIPLFHYLGEFAKPVIGAVNGVALGGGAELALVCDIRIAVPHARFGQTEIRWGMIPSAGGCQRLRTVAGIAVAKELIYTGRLVEAEEACTLGIYSRIVQAEGLLEEAVKLADLMGGHSSHALIQAKKVIDFGAGVSYLQTFDLEASKECFYRGKAMTGHRSFGESR
jgi:enoyl-CoA hydratase/carnithine racemase